MGKGPGKEWFTQLRLLLLGVVSWFAVTVIGELIGNQANETTTGQAVGHYVLLTALVVVPAALVIGGVLALRERRRSRSPIAEDETAPSPKLLAPPVWYPQPSLCGRDNEVRNAAQLLLTNRIVLIVGPRDVGTSAVGRAAAQRLIDSRDGEARTTTRFDLRSRSASAPDDAVATAGRVVSPFGVDEPADETDEVLARVARRLVEQLEPNGILLLDNVTAPEQVAWLVREWPADGPMLMVVGETALRALVTRSTVEVGPMALPHLRELWRQERTGTEQPKSLLSRGFSKVRRTLRHEPDDEVDELLPACFGRPRAVKAIAQEIDRPGSRVTLRDLLTELRKEGLVEGPLERVWQALLANLREGLSTDAAWLLAALAELPVTGLIKGAVAAMLGVSDDPVALEELRIRNLVEEVDGRYRLPQEIRRAIEGTTKEEDRRAVALRAVPKLVRFYRGYADLWAARLTTDPHSAEAWFRVSEQSFRPLYGNTYLDDELLALVLDDLCGIADALDRWYVRQRQASGMLAVNSGLYGLVDRAGRPDLAALAAIRMATAHRLGRRYGEAAAQLDVARTHIEPLLDARIRSELDSREQVARALLALDRESGAEEAYAALSGLRVATPAVLINVGALCLARKEVEDALEHLLRAEELAKDIDDLDAVAHSQELQGVCLSHQNLVEAVRLWQVARGTFNRIGDEQGEARCLQHLGAAALVDRAAAGQLSRGDPDPISSWEAAAVALKHLTQAKSLKTGQPDTTVVDGYLKQARESLQASAQ